MIILIGMWLCILYCIIKYVLKFSSVLSIVFFSFIIFVFFTLIVSDAGHIWLGMALGGIVVLFGIGCIVEGNKRVNDQENTIKEIKEQDKYDDDLGFNDFNK